MTLPTNPLAKIFDRYGLSLLLLLGTPLLPGVTQAHVTLYLTLFYPKNPNINSYIKGITLLFGDLGIQALREYSRLNKIPILPHEIFLELYRYHDPDEALKLIQRLFFDAGQRAHPQADLYRAAVIQHLPKIFSRYPGNQFQTFRSTLIQKVASLVEIDQAIPSRLAALNTSATLITQEVKNNQTRKDLLIVAQFESLSARLKAELAGHASIATADFSSIIPKPGLPPVLLSDQDLATLKTIILHLAQSHCPDLVDQAQHILKNLPTLEKS